MAALILPLKSSLYDEATGLNQEWVDFNALSQMHSFVRAKLFYDDVWGTENR